VLKSNLAGFTAVGKTEPYFGVERAKKEKPPAEAGGFANR
jgi:hypothetical protein